MPWQQQVADVALEVVNGRPVYREVRITVPRQQGKTALILAAMLHRCLMWSDVPQKVMYSAQTGKDAREKMLDDFAPAIERSAMRAALRRINRGMGNESIQWTNGSFIKKLESSESSGHGKTLHQATIDEAFKDADARREQALVPAMNTVPDGQLWIISTAGTPIGSPYLWAKVESGRLLATNHDHGGIAYFEWSASEDADPDDPTTWRSCMPALGHTIDESVVRHARQSLPDAEFRRAYLNQWVTQQDDPVIPVDAWSAAIDHGSRRGDRLTFAVDVSPDRATASIAVASERPDGLLHVEIVDARAGTWWVTDRMSELVARWSPDAVVIDASGPAGALVHGLEAHSVPLERTVPADVPKACGAFYDQVLAGRVRHLGQTELTTSVLSARRQPMGDSWRWSRRSSSVDISPLMAATLASWRAQAPAQEFFAF
jgi:phage terminase large subunit-like protein